ncbi:MAG: PspC domain-containing protein [Caldilineales bacterium]
MKKELQRSRNNRVIAGVCGGIGAYFGIDPVLVRVLAVVLGLGSFGTLLVLYLLLAFIIPLEQ